MTRKGSRALAQLRGWQGQGTLGLREESGMKAASCWWQTNNRPAQ